MKEIICFSQDIFVKQLDGITIYPWTKGMKRFFANNDSLILLVLLGAQSPIYNHDNFHHHGYSLIVPSPLNGG